MTLEADVNARDQEDNLYANILQANHSLNPSIEITDMEDFVHADDENSEEYAAAILEDVEEYLESMKQCDDDSA